MTDFDLDVADRIDALHEQAEYYADLAQTQKAQGLLDAARRNRRHAARLVRQAADLRARAGAA